MSYFLFFSYPHLVGSYFLEGVSYNLLIHANHTSETHFSTKSVTQWLFLKFVMMKMMKYNYLIIFIIAIFRNSQSRFTKQDATGSTSTKKEKKRTKFPSQKPKKTKDSKYCTQGRWRKTKMIAMQWRRR